MTAHDFNAIALAAELVGVNRKMAAYY